MDESSVKPEASTPAASEPAGAMLTMAKAASNADEPTVEVALRWSEIYKNDHEFSRFWKWLGERSNSERTDQHDILESIPLHFEPDQLPLPLRKHFLRKFDGEKSKNGADHG